MYFAYFSPEPFAHFSFTRPCILYRWESGVSSCAVLTRTCALALWTRSCVRWRRKRDRAGLSFFLSFSFQTRTHLACILLSVLFFAPSHSPKRRGSYRSVGLMDGHGLVCPANQRVCERERDVHMEKCLRLEQGKEKKQAPTRTHVYLYIYMCVYT